MDLWTETKGTSKSSDKHFKTYLETSLGSAFEWETQLIIAYKIKYINKEKFDEYSTQIIKIQKMISKFKDSL